MGAATRVEEAIGAAERSRLDLVPLIESAGAAYRGAFPERRLAAGVPAGPVVLGVGAPQPPPPLPRPAPRIGGRPLPRRLPGTALRGGAPRRSRDAGRCCRP